jgi:hypothetical protein
MKLDKSPVLLYDGREKQNAHAASAGNRCFLLAQGYISVQEFHVLKNLFHEQNRWYYASGIQPVRQEIPAKPIC